jgi:hypothetical protein
MLVVLNPVPSVVIGHLETPVLCELREKELERVARGVSSAAVYHVT